MDWSLVVPLELSIGFSVFGHQSHGPASLPDHQENHLIWVDSSLIAPLELPVANAHAVQPPRLTIQEPSDLSGLSPSNLPLDFMHFVHLSYPCASLVGWSMIIVCIYCIFNSNSVSLFSQIIQCKYPFQFSFNSVICSLFNHYLIIVQLLFSILMLEMYSMSFDPIKK